MKAALLLSGGLLFMPGPVLAPRPPVEYIGNTAQVIEVLYADPSVVHAVCRDLINTGNPPSQRIPDDWTIYACTNTKERRSLLPDPCLPQFANESFAATACHEKGHANGWGWEYA